MPFSHQIKLVTAQPLAA